MTWTPKDAAILRKLDRKILDGKATRADALKAFDLQRKKKAKREEAEAH